MAYATLQDFATYLNVAVGALPSNASTLLERGSEIIDYATLGRIDISDSAQLTIAKKANCQQAEYYMSVGLDYDIKGKQEYEQLSIGSWSANYNLNDKTPLLAPRAKRTLFLGGMLYRGVGMI